MPHRVVQTLFAVRNDGVCAMRREREADAGALHHTGFITQRPAELPVGVRHKAAENYMDGEWERVCVPWKSGLAAHTRGWVVRQPGGQTLPCGDVWEPADERGEHHAVREWVPGMSRDPALRKTGGGGDGRGGTQELRVGVRSRTGVARGEMCVGTRERISMRRHREDAGRARDVCQQHSTLESTRVSEGGAARERGHRVRNARMEWRRR